jgi:rhamnose transport system substrate-binding protein
MSIESRRRLLVIDPSELILVVVIVAEILVFSRIGTHFFSVANGLEVIRLSVEIGLLALALTPVIVGGGIDLSVGSLMGLSAILFGKLWRDAGLPIAFVVPLTLLVGAIAGGLNGFLITRLRIPALIVTLGSFSLFRGLAEGWTGGVDNFTNFPSAFLFLGQGYLPGEIPSQVPLFLVVALGFWVLLHRTTIGRSLFAIGFSPEGARYAGLPVDRRIALTYLLSGTVASLAAIIYVAHLGQAKADAGTGYELLAITAVVLGGTSIFGGRGSIVGTLLGLLAIAILKNGLSLADFPSEVAGILTGTMLLGAIGLDRRYRIRRQRSSASTISSDPNEVMTMKNAQVAMICASILAAGLLVAGPTLYLSYLIGQSQRPTFRAADHRKPAEDDRKTLEDHLKQEVAKINPPRILQDRPITVAMMPKSKGNAYFIACKKGAEVAAKEQGVKLIWDGPTDPDPARQNEIVDTWITRGVDVIAVAVENREGISSVLRKARSKGIKVVTWDADADPDARDFFVNQATPQGIGEALMDNAARIMGEQGEFAIITASLTAANMIAWQKEIEIRRAEKYPNIKMVALRPCDDLQKKAFDETNTLLASNPKIKLIMAICTPAVPGAAEAIKQSGRNDVKVLGLGLPNDNKAYVHEGITDSLILWNTADLGYLAVLTAKAVVNQTLKPGDRSFKAGHLDEVKLDGDNVLLGKPFSFTKENIDQFDF